MTSNTLLIIQFYADVVKQVFLGLDTVEYEGISILDIFLAIMFFNILVWLIQRLLNRQLTPSLEGQEIAREHEREMAESKRRDEYFLNYKG